jgi:hypothetical protein
VFQDHDPDTAGCAVKCFRCGYDEGLEEGHDGLRCPKCGALEGLTRGLR